MDLEGAGRCIFEGMPGRKEKDQESHAFVR